VTRIDAVRALEVLDSRGDPTVRVAVESDGHVGRFTVPSGASTGAHEAHERRDGGDRYRGRGVREAVAAVEGEIADAVVGRDVSDQRGLDEALCDLDGTDDLGRLGANAVLGVSGAALHAASRVAGRPLYEHVAAELAGSGGTAGADADAGDDDADAGDGTDAATPGASGGPGSIPLPMVNVLSGGQHAHGGLEIQDVLVVPVAAADYASALEAVWAVRQSVRDLIVDRGERPLVADEGGFSPSLPDATAAFELVREGIEAAGFAPGREVALAVDVAATEFYDAARGRYDLDGGDDALDAAGMVERVLGWVERYPVVSIEDPLAEDDWAAWRDLLDRAPPDLQVLGDDLLVTNGTRVERAIERGAANAVLVKPNQAGTVTRAVDAVATARRSGLNTVVSARSGETCDATIADLAVGLDAGWIKIGSLARSERLAKYNRLLEIDAETDLPLAPLEPPAGPAGTGGGSGNDAGG
jgi:enolase